MNRKDPYLVLARELQAWQQRPYSQLVDLVNQPATETIVKLAEEEVSLRVELQWANSKNGTIRIKATAYGPSCWKLERLEESIVVSPQPGTTTHMVQ